MGRAQWTQTKNLYNDIRDKLLDDPRMKMMLAHRMRQLSHQLQTQINQDPHNMNEARAFLIMQEELQKIAHNMQTLLKKKFQPNMLNNPNSLQFAQNMQQLLNNPYSIAGEMMRDTAAANIESQNTEHEANIQAVIAQAQASESGYDSDSADANASHISYAELITLGETTADAIKVLDHVASEAMKDVAVGKVFKEAFGKELKPHELLREREETAGESLLSKARVPTPQSFASKVIDKEK